MPKLKTMIDRISEREKNSFQNKYNDEKRKAELEIKKAELDAKERLENEKEEIVEKLKFEFSMKENTEEVNKRNAVLREKQKVIQRTLKEASKKMREISSEEFMQVVTTALENVDVTQSVQLFIGEKSEALLDKEWLNNYLPWNHHVKIQPNLIEGKAGIILRVNNVDYNYLFDRLIEENLQDLLPHITSELFDE